MRQHDDRSDQKEDLAIKNANSKTGVQQSIKRDGPFPSSHMSEKQIACCAANNDKTLIYGQMTLHNVPRQGTGMRRKRKVHDFHRTRHQDKEAVFVALDDQKEVCALIAFEIRKEALVFVALNYHKKVHRTRLFSLDTPHSPCIPT